MRRYRAVAGEAEEALEAVFKRHFADWEDPTPPTTSEDSPPET